MGTTRTRRLLAAIAMATTCVLLAAGCEPTPAWMKVPITGYTPVSYRKVGSITGDQGPATVHYLSGTVKQVFGGEQIAQSFKDAGWTHLGDPDSLNAYIVWPYQASDPAQGKMFNVVTPHGQSYRYTHALVEGEEYNNSFAAISPDGKWLVSGEWDTEPRLLVFPMPILNSSVPSGNRPLPLAATITLSTPIDFVQGCDFTSSTHLICSSDDAAKHLFNITLPHALNGTDTTGAVRSLGTLPQVSDTCKGTFEAEGLDYDPPSKELRVEIIPPSPCFAFTDQYTYVRKS